MEAKERIAIKAAELFIRYGIRSVSMDDIANNLGMSKKTVYQYYADKDELVEWVVKTYFTNMENDCMGVRRSASNAIDEIFISIDTIMDNFNNMNPLLIHDMEKFHYRSYQHFMDYKNKFLQQMIRDNIEWGISEELYRPDVNIDIMSKFRLESMMIPFNVAIFPPGKYNMGTLSRELLIHFIYGMATIKGFKLIQKYIQQRQKNLTHEQTKK